MPLLNKPRFNMLLPMATLIVAFFSLGVGQYSISPMNVWHALMSPMQTQDLAGQIIWTVRMPRILMACCAGGALALCGACLQGVFHNPLVDPHIIGVSSGAAFGGTLAILLGLSPLWLMSSTFAFGLLALVLVYAIASTLGNENRLMLILSGIILSGFFCTGEPVAIYGRYRRKLPSIVFWLLGSFATANWHKLLMMVIPLALASFYCFACAGG